MTVVSVPYFFTCEWTSLVPGNTNRSDVVKEEKDDVSKEMKDGAAY
jgi:hypothetical protein